MHKISIPSWARERGSRNRIERIDAAKTALLVVDLQNCFMLEGQPLANPHACDIVPNVNELTGSMRTAGGQVVFLRHTFSEEPPYRLNDWQRRMATIGENQEIALRPNQFTHALYSQLDVRSQDVVVNKHRFSAFKPNSSMLDDMLRARGIDTVVVCGTITNVCCESTARDAEMLGYKVFFIMDATAALSDEEHNATLLSMTAYFADVRATSDMVGLIRESAAA